jgi:hypothetical protein
MVGQMNSGKVDSRTPFQKWIDRQPSPAWTLLPFTHITRGLVAEKILSQGFVEARHCPNFDKPLAYLFYGRPAYRANTDKVIALEGSSPFCFIFSNDLIQSAERVSPFDTGALSNRMYDHILDEGLEADDFSVGNDLTRVAKLVSATFQTHHDYFLADRSRMRLIEDVSEAWEMQARAYLTLVGSPGRNAPDDRICTIEAAFGGDVPLSEKLLAVVVPHTVWNDGNNPMPLLNDLAERHVRIATYKFVPSRPPEYYQTLIEGAVRELYIEWGFLDEE